MISTQRENRLFCAFVMFVIVFMAGRAHAAAPSTFAYHELQRDSYPLARISPYSNMSFTDYDGCIFGNSLGKINIYYPYAYSDDSIRRLTSCNDWLAFIGLQPAALGNHGERRAIYKNIFLELILQTNHPKDPKTAGDQVATAVKTIFNAEPGTTMTVGYATAKLDSFSKYLVDYVNDPNAITPRPVQIQYESYAEALSTLSGMMKTVFSGTSAAIQIEEMFVKAAVYQALEETDINMRLYILENYLNVAKSSPYMSDQAILQGFYDAKDEANRILSAHHDGFRMVLKVAGDDLLRTGSTVLSLDDFLLSASSLYLSIQNPIFFESMKPYLSTLSSTLTKVSIIWTSIQILSSDVGGFWRQMEESVITANLIADDNKGIGCTESGGHCAIKDSSSSVESLYKTQLKYYLAYMHGKIMIGVLRGDTFIQQVAIGWLQLLAQDTRRAQRVDFLTQIIENDAHKYPEGIRDTIDRLNVALMNANAMENLSAPDIISPLNGSTNVQQKGQVFSWSNIGSTRYRIQIAPGNVKIFDNSTDSRCTNCTVNTVVRNTSFNMAQLISDTQYSWRVRAENGSIPGIWSDVSTFRTVSATPVVCMYQLATTIATFNSAGGSGAVNVTAGSTCAWTAVSNVPWIHITSGSSGTGTGTVRHLIDAYAGSTNRTGTITIAGQTYTVTQTPPPSVSGSISYISPISCATVPASGFNLTFSADFSDSGQISIHSGSTPSASNLIASSSGFSFAANTPKSIYSGSLSNQLQPGTYYWVVGTASKVFTPAQCFTVQQSCSYSLSATSKTFDSSGGTGTVTATSATGCNWTATSNVSWIHITSGSGGSGSGTVTYSVDAYTGGSNRTGTISIAGQTYTVTQTPPQSCSFSLTNTSNTFNSAGGNGTVNVNATAGCSWAAISNASWIHVTGGGTGSGPVSYSVDAYSGNTTRTGTMTIAGQTYTVTQTPPINSGSVTYTSPINGQAVTCSSGFYFQFQATFSDSGQIGIFSGTPPSAGNQVSSSSTISITANTQKQVYGSGSMFYPNLCNLPKGTYYWQLFTSGGAQGSPQRFVLQ